MLILGCHPGDCHYKEQNCRALQRHAILLRLLRQFGVEEERCRFDFISAAEGEEFARVVAEMTAAREAFKRSVVIQFANFMPGEWLPGEDHGYLRSVYTHANRIGVGVGGPDLLPHRDGQKNHSYPMIAARDSEIPAAIAVQQGNLSEINPSTGQPVTVTGLYRFAKERLCVDYLFWGTQEPYYSDQVLPFLRSLATPRESAQ